MHVDAIRDALHRQPFQPFYLRLVDGRTVLVPHPDFVAIAPRTLIVVSSVDGSITWLEPLLVQAIEWPGAPPQGNAPAADGAG